MCKNLNIPGSSFKNKINAGIASCGSKLVLLLFKDYRLPGVNFNFNVLLKHKLPNRGKNCLLIGFCWKKNQVAINEDIHLLCFFVCFNFVQASLNAKIIET